MNIHAKGTERESARDIICLDFDFGSRSYEEEKEHLLKLKSMATKESQIRIDNILSQVEKNKYKYKKLSKDGIREQFYSEGVCVRYNHYDKKGNVIKTEAIDYAMLYRNSSKAKLGQVMFIRKELYDVAYDWLTMGLGKKMPRHNAKIVEMSAYAPLTTSTIVDTIAIPVKDILILKDVDSIFKIKVKAVKAENYECDERIIDEDKTRELYDKAISNGKLDLYGNPIYKQQYKKEKVTKKRCVVSDEELEIKNTLWDGMALIEHDCCPEWVNGMALLRQHFFKSDAFVTYIQKFFKSWCLKNDINYDTYEIKDMFGISHKLKDIKMITTHNAVKWLKFKDLMGNSLQEAYQYWCDRVNENGSLFGIVKTDHVSKLGDVQQMSYQMINTLDCTAYDVEQIAEISKNCVERLKTDDEYFKEFLIKNSNKINHYMMLADMYEYNPNIAKTNWFRKEKSSIIKNYVAKLRSGKITVPGDNLTVCGNPYALLLYAVGENYENDPTLEKEDGAIQCYTTRFADGEYLCAFRNPHNSPNGVVHLHNVYSKEMREYFPFSENIIAVNNIHTDIQDRCNGMDYDFGNWVG